MIKHDNDRRMGRTADQLRGLLRAIAEGHRSLTFVGFADVFRSYAIGLFLHIVSTESSYKVYSKSRDRVVLTVDGRNQCTVNFTQPESLISFRGSSTAFVVDHHAYTTMKVVHHEEIEGRLL